MRPALLLMLGAPAVLGAQGWVVETQKSVNPKVSAMIAHMSDVMRVVRRDPETDRPPGYTVSAKIRASQSSPKTMVSGVLSALLIAGNTIRGEGLGFTIVANNVACARGEKADIRDEAGEFYTAVAPHTYHGLPMYGETGCILVTRRIAPVVVPVTRERAARALLKMHDGEAAVIAEVQRELGAMSAAERTAPAILDIAALTQLQIDGKVAGAILPHGDGETTARLVAANPDFYDHSRMSDVQALTVSFDCLDGHGSPWCAGYKGVFERIRDGIDWDALARMTTP